MLIVVALVACVACTKSLPARMNRLADKIVENADKYTQEEWNKLASETVHGVTQISKSLGAFMSGFSGKV